LMMLEAGLGSATVLGWICVANKLPNGVHKTVRRVQTCSDVIRRVYVSTVEIEFLR